MKKIIRQGDILFTKVEGNIGGKGIKQIIVAEGEFTGHNHVLVAEVGSQVIGDKSKFEVKGKAKLIHPDHATIEFKSGVYVVSVEREFDYINETLKQVMD